MAVGGPDNTLFAVGLHGLMATASANSTRTQRVWQPVSTGVQADLLALWVSDMHSAKRKPGIAHEPSYFGLVAGAKGTILFCDDITVSDLWACLLVYLFVLLVFVLEIWVARLIITL